MFCGKCGSKIEDGEKFCSVCGTPVAGAEGQESNSVKKPMESPDGLPPISYTSGSTQGDGGNIDIDIDKIKGAAANIVNNAAEKGKAVKEKVQKSGSDEKNKGILIWGPVIGAAVLVLVLLAANGSRINNFVHKTFSSPEKYYQYVEKKAIKEVSANAGEIYDDYILNALNFYDKSAEMKLNLELGKDGKEYVELLGLAGVDLSWLKSAEIGVNASIKNEVLGAGGEVAINNSDILSGKLGIDLGKSRVYMQVPELNSKYIGVEYDESDSYELEELLNVQRANKKLLNALPTQNQVTKIANRYLSTAVECVENVDKDKDRIEAEGISQKCTVLKVKINERTVQNIAKTVLKEMKDDKEIKDIMLNVAKEAGKAMDVDYDEKELYENFQDAIEDAIDSLDYLYLGGDTVMYVYVNSKGEIIGRKIKVEDGTVSYLMPEKGKKFGYEFSVKADDINVKLSGSGKKSGDKLSGDFTFKYNGASLLDITAKNLNTEDMKVGRMNGRLELKASSAVGSLLGSVLGSSMSSIFDDSRITLDFDSSVHSVACKVGVIYDGKDLGKVTLSYKDGNGSSTSVPSGSNVTMIEDLDDLADWAEEVNLKNFVSKLKKANLPEEITEYVEDLDDLSELIDMLEYYY